MEADRLADEYILKGVERYIKNQELKKLLQNQ